MIRTRTRKILSDVWARKVRTLLVAASIFVGVFGVVTLFSTGELLVRQLEKDIQQDSLAMIRTVVSVPAGANVDNEAALDTLRNQPGVTIVEGRAVYFLQWMLEGDTRFREGVLAAYSEPFDQLQLEAPRLTRGDYPVAGENQIAIERRMADAHGLDIGDTITLRILSRGDTPGANGEAVTEDHTIVGIMFQAYGEQNGPGYADPESIVFAAYDDAQHIAGFSGLSQIYTRFVDFNTAESQQSDYQIAIANQTPYVPVFSVVEDPAASALIEQTKQTNRILVILAMVALVVSGFLVVNVVNSIVVEQRKQIGVMKSMGATRLDNIYIYTGIATVYGIIGVIPGVLLGIPGGYFAAQGLAAQSNTIIEEFGVSITGIVIGVLVGLAVPFLAAIVPVINGTRVTIREAMSDVGIDAKYGGGPISRLIALIPMPIALRQAVNSVNRKKFRLALTGTTLTVAVGAFMGIFAVFSSLSDVIDDTFNTFGSQIAIQPNEGQSMETITAILKDPDFAAKLEAEGLPALKAIEPGANLSVKIEGYDPPPIQAGPPGLFAIGIETSNPDVANLSLKSGQDWTDNPDLDGIVISSRIAELMDKAVGDEIVMLAGGQRAAFTILGIASFPFDTVWMPWEDLARLGGLVVDAPTAHSYAMGTTYVSVSGYDGSADGQTGILGMTTTPDQEASRLLSMADGSFYTPGEREIIISTDLAAAGNYGVGDTLVLTLNGSTDEYTVSGVFDLPAQLQDNADHPRDVIGMYWQDLAALDGRDFAGDPYPNNIDVILDAADPSAATVDEIISVINEAMLERGITAEYTNWVEFSETITSFVLVFNIILYLAAALIAAVGAIGLLTSLSMSVFERQKEIGVMRSVGATSWAVFYQFLIEGITVGVAAWAFGIPLGYVISRGLINALPFEAFGVGFPPETVLIGLAGMLVVVTLASLWPSLAAARKTVSNILRYQ